MTTALRSRPFVVHYLQMIAAMLAGMLLLGPLAMLVFGHPGPEAHALLMATEMTIGMTVWMAWKHHSWIAIAEMGLAMYLSFVVLFPLLWTGLLSGGAMMIVGHVLMLPAMALVMLRRREEYSGR
ncbi:hypothetical protein [Pseudonocardia sp.]|uniref:hypothetical protein n=1 Tax=Pseudonocardia sp. TaxID=60912 RepID=UPI003D0E6DE6